jgi:MFS superfamily sulfate permease-like transporter
MKAFFERHLDTLTAVGVALVLLPLALAYFDILTY